MQIGNFQGQEPQRTHEEQAHFGLWTIVSSPLILGVGALKALTRRFKIEWTTVRV